MKTLETPNQVADYLSKIAKEGIKEVIQPKKRGRPKGSKNKAKWAGGKKPGAQPGKPVKPTKITGNPLVDLNLMATHNLNGVLYGPGPVKVPHGIAETLREAEQRAITYDQTWRDEKAVIIQPGIRGGSHLRLTRVSPAMFDQAEIPPIGTMQGLKNMNGEVTDWQWRGN